MQSFSDEQLRRASGGKVVQDSKTKLYSIIDDDDGSVVNDTDNKDFAKTLDAIYHMGKAKGQLIGLAEGRKMNDRFISDLESRRLI